MRLLCAFCDKPARDELTNYVDALTTGDAVWTPGQDPIVADLSEPEDVGGRIREIEQHVYFWYLNDLPPRWLWRRCFCTSEGVRPFRLFWANESGCFVRRRRYFVRRLTWEQTYRICELARLTVEDLF